jgi:phage replication O-like protein O
MNVARHLTLVSTSPEVVEHRVAQLEDGFTRVANELLDAVMASGLSETEMCVVLAVWRKTYGYSKKMDWISNEQLEAMIGKHLTHCSTAKNLLINKKVLLQEGRKVGMNTNVADWKTKINGFCKTLAKPAKKRLAEVANSPLQKVLTTKDNNTKEKKDNTQTHDVGLSVEEKLTPRQKGTNPRAKGTNPRSAMPAFDRDRLKETWNCKADRYGIPKIRNISTTTENGLKRLWASYLKQCKDLGTQPNEIDTFLNGYLEHGYKPTKWACGENPDGRKYGIETALRQEKIDEILSRED